LLGIEKMDSVLVTFLIVVIKIPENILKGRIIYLGSQIQGVSPSWQGEHEETEQFTSKWSGNR
jgi:hypothetical protein